MTPAPALHPGTRIVGAITGRPGVVRAEPVNGRVRVRFEGMPTDEYPPCANLRVAEPEQMRLEAGE